MTLTGPFTHFCITGGRAIFLDIHRNRYFALPSEMNEAFVAMIGERDCGAIDSRALDEIARGAMPSDFGDNEPGVVSLSRIAVPEGDRLAFQAQLSDSLALVLLAWCALVIAKILVLICPLHLVLGTLGKNDAPINQRSDSQVVDRIAAAFHKATLLIRRDGNCLPLTLAFVWLCRLSGHRPTLVIGVRVNPFSAHCWSQDGAIVLNDACERVLPYQPILAL